MKTGMKKRFRAIRDIAMVCYFLLLCLSFLSGPYRKKYLASPVLQWKYDEIVNDNLSEEWQWIKEKAFKTRADDEGAWAYITDVCGNDKPEVVLNYFIDGIFFANSEHMEIYSSEKELLFQDEKTHYYTGLNFGLLKINGARPIYGYGQHPIAGSYAYKNGRYIRWFSGLPVSWSWLLASVFTWAVNAPPETGLLFVIMQIIFCWLLFLAEQRLIPDSRGFRYKSFIKRICILLGVETLIAVPSSIVPLFFLAGRACGIILLHIILQPSKKVKSLLKAEPKISRQPGF